MSTLELMPIAPTLLLRPMRPEDEAVVRPAINRQLLRAAYSMELDPRALLANLLQPNPPTLYTVRWQRHQSFCVLRAGALEGLINVAVGLDSDSLDLPDYSPLGLLRFLLLPTMPGRVDEVADLLMTAATTFWQTHGVGYIKAFHMSTGYPEFQAGLGALPGDWHEQIRVLTSSGFQLSERFYALIRPLEQPLEERLPVAGLTLVFRGKATDRHYQIYHQSDRIGEARLAELPMRSTFPSSTPSSGTQRLIRIANLVNLFIHPEWRGRDIGKWLLRRLINDATFQGYHQMLVHLPHRAFIMQNLLTQHSFQEQNYRGYTLERSLTR